MMIVLILMCFAVFLGSCFLTYLIRRYALHKNVIDIPNARSSHSTPTPRGGGLSIVIMVLLPLLLLYIAGAINTSGVWQTGEYSAIIVKNDNGMGLAGLLALFAVAGIGFWDDHQHIPARWRLLVHFAASALVLWAIFPSYPDLQFFGWKLTNPFIIGTLALFGLVWLLNLYNFMDGIDGIASVEAISVLLGATALLFLQHKETNSVALIMFASTIAGFLVWNWPHAKIFMGDACSGFLGFSLGMFALSSPEFGNLWSWLILLAVFITDATFTLVKRILNKEKWYEAHSSHAYQRYARQLIEQFQQQGYEHSQARTKSHRRINFLLIAINVFWLLPLAFAASAYPYWAVIFAAIAFAPLIFIAYRLKAGTAQ